MSLCAHSQGHNCKLCWKFGYDKSSLFSYRTGLHYISINSQLDETVTNFIDNYNHLSMFRAIISPTLRSTRLCLQLGTAVPPHPCHQQAASPVHYTTSCKHSLVLLRMGEIIARNMLSWLKLSVKFVIVALFDCLYYCISDARSHRHQIELY